MDALPGKPTAADKSTQVPKYWGYTAWDVDHREPNFTGCYDFDCHPKTVVRPEVRNALPSHHSSAARVKPLSSSYPPLCSAGKLPLWSHQQQTCSVKRRSLEAFCPVLCCAAENFARVPTCQR